MAFLTTLLLIGLVLQVSSGIYFTRSRLELCLPIDTDIGSALGRLFAYSSTGDDCSKGALQFDVDAAHVGTLSINATGWIRLDKLLTNTTGTGTIEVPVTASCKGEDGVVFNATSTLSLNLATHTAATGVPPVAERLTDRMVKDGCFNGFPDTLLVEENVENIALATAKPCSLTPGFQMKYVVKSPKANFLINSTNDQLMITKSLDRESLIAMNNKLPHSRVITGLLTLKIQCNLTVGGVSYRAQTKRITVKVSDVNDNPPMFERTDNTPVGQYVEHDVKFKPGEKIREIRMTVMDNDTQSYSPHEVTILSDPKGVCAVANKCHSSSTGITACYFDVNPDVNKIQTFGVYTCKVSLEDPTYKPPPDSQISSSVTMVIHFRRQDIQNTQASPGVTSAIPKTRFYRNATRLARLALPRPYPYAVRGSRYILVNPVFAVTPRRGIVYLNDTHALQKSPDTVVLNVMTSDGRSNYSVTLEMIGSGRGPEDCDYGCSERETTAKCLGSCGFGLVAGNCVMRGKEITAEFSPNYGTCTHDVTTCPDGVCDELEETYPPLCPQDCTRSAPIGFGFLNKNRHPPQGIERAKSPCFCEAYMDDTLDDIACTCMPPISAPAPVTKVPLEASQPEAPVGHASISHAAIGETSTLPRTETEAEQSTTEKFNSTLGRQIEAVASETTGTSCDLMCRTAIGVCLGVFIAISFSLFMLWFTKKKGDNRKNSMKHVGSVASMPSEYYEERDRRASLSSPQWSPKGPISSSYITRPENGKWEIPRDHLTLEKTLGEGEFGLVVKARAYGINGNDAERTVAVKMLKHCSTQAEEQDLWSEFNLLKDVSHPNVIRLLGACMGDGPFYVIVEFCEHGCLLSYLRRCCLEENGYVNNRLPYRYKSPNAREQTDPEREGELLTMRDLLSFAWQIAKGMSYLSEIKLVHRDLAARNVLVSSGKLLKISDFGLTRDVYEADTYLKKSRGRIPVKWLAPESLYAQIYTTRSDVWSYGIVLWEVVTLGAPPYPGIPPERLYNLLIGGYRMDKPENCPDEMYAVMQKCWKTDAADRPAFKSIAEIFDRILQEKSGYLDLSPRIDGRQNDLYTRCFDAGEQGHLRYREEHDRQEGQMTVPVEERRNAGEDNTLTVPRTVCNNAYLTPSAGLTGEQEKITPLLEPPRPEQEPKVGKKSPVFGKHKADIECPDTNNSMFGKKNVIYPSEKMSLLLENGTARFMNAYEVSDDRELNDSIRIELE